MNTLHVDLHVLVVGDAFVAHGARQAQMLGVAVTGQGLEGVEHLPALHTQVLSVLAPGVLAQPVLAIKHQVADGACEYWDVAIV